ncbi:hypothetical protein SAMN04489859_10706 [Paracoccus alcaliphilus]|uniref:Uncharacterized protein n=1 Tax=Paracoccus alcaliphilus TaxID=34002 RepID=A0A1H8NTV8_9RHOB|nr:hypothetical protein [Paracoccus alcaliphilus]WCR18568.1 hypothetical protein JHW40_02065 [Paracoccus alcaliphilus]SEO33029.1 hypothetical protein SAMN04489859_10706 [Paracoccus alcaliphilus]
MDDLSTTRAANDPVAGCECSCDRGWQDVQDEVNQALRSDDPLERNRQITAAYDGLAEADPRNIWVRLASYVSVQGGCAMQRTQAWDAQTLGRMVVNPSEAMDALQDANRTIFSNIYPVARFAQKCGAKQLRRCVESGAFEADPSLLDAMDMLEKGELRTASDLIAEHEQVDIVQPVYERHADTFRDLMRAEALIPFDQTSIPIAKHCTRDNLVSIDGLDVRDPRDRVQYYRRLVNRMLQQERTSRHGATGTW